MSESFANRTPLDSTGATGGGQHVAGMVTDVDTVAREVHVLLPSGLRTVDIPPQCPIVLRGERIKLRMVQAGDQVRLAYVTREERFVAQRLEVQPASAASALSM